MSNTDTQTSASMHNSFIERSQLQNFPDRQILKETLHRFISYYVLCYTRSVPNTSIVAASFILITMITGTVGLLQSLSGTLTPSLY